MKRAGGLIKEIVDLENLKQAFCRAATGKRDRPSVRAFARDLETNLKLKEWTPVHRVEAGLSFLGFRVFPSGLRLDGRSRKRLVRTYCRYQAEFRDGEWSEREYQQRLEALFAFARQADSRDFRVRLLRRHGDFSD